MRKERGVNAHRYALEPGMRAVLTDLGLRPASVLRRAGVRADLLAGGPVSLSQREFFALWRAIEDELGDPNLPLRIGEVLSAEAFGAPLFAGLLSADLNTAAKRIAKYKRLVAPAELIVDATSDSTAISYQWPDRADPPHTLVLSELLFWVQLARIGTRQHIQPIELNVPYPPDDLDAYRAFLGAEVRQSDVQQVVFAADDAAREFLTANDVMWATFETDLRRRLADLEPDATTAQRVRSVLLELLPVGKSNLAEVAYELAMSTRTLHRRLAVEQTSFQQILDTTREDLARHYLANSNLTAIEIAFLLGFEETSSFYRAFNNWTGQTPDQVRTASR